MSARRHDTARPRFVAPVAACALALLLGGCASGPAIDPRDPLEPLNRGVFQFNEAVDATVMKPVATAYKAVTPQLVRTGVHNFFSNLGEIWSTVNNALQLKPRETVESFMRVSVNTVLGIGGLIDLAGAMGMEPHKEDFGQTLGRWGVPSGPYLVLPLLGPSTLRDTAAMGVESEGSVVRQLDDVRTRNALIGLDVVDTRASLLRAGEVLDEAAIDKYSFRRDVYLQKRRNDVYDGSPPPEPEPSEPPDIAPAPGPRP